jgi:ABC-type uncharacterized transport system involved in gliding motility auxiliary subunit
MGALAIGAAFIAIGMATSAYVASSVGAFLLGAAISFGLILAGLDFVVLMLPGLAGNILTEMTILPHLTNLSRGVLDLRDLTYFATIIGLALSATVLKLSERKVAENRGEKVKLFIIMGLIVAIGLAGNVFLYQYPIRIDATTNQQYSLSEGTKKLLKDLPDRVTVTLYTSPNLPGPMQATMREANDLLKDLARYGKRLTVKTVTVAPNSPNAQEAQQKGIRQVQFNQIGTSSFAVQTGFLGLNVQYGSKNEVIDFIDDASGLEYQLSRIIVKLTRDNQPQIGLLMNTTNQNFTQINQYLQKQYKVVNLSSASTDKEAATLTSIIVIDDGSDSTSTSAAVLKNYLNNNGNAVLFVNGVTISQQALTGSPSKSPYLNVLTDWGASVNQDLVYDLQMNEAISLGSGTSRYIMPYPFWIRSILNQNNLPWKSADNSVVLGWPSSLNVTQKDKVVIKPILTTSTSANVLTTDLNIAPDQTKSLAPPSGTQYPMAVIIEKDKQRLSLVANTMVAADDFLQNSKENGAFVANLIDWATADPILMSIPQKSGGRTVFLFKTPAQIQMVQYTAIIAPPALVAIIGFWWLNRRKRRTQRVYTHTN